ncbi:glycosyl hydrolase family 3 C-terminal domain-containing protein [Lentinula edodes]|nr:glycosyl hydrolase family 3 C-terminal domain-containing protein [Lentinula edodes]
MDAESLNLTGDADDLVAQAVNSSSNVVVVIHATGAVNIEKWADNPNVTAIIAASLPGQESGAGLVPVLYGDVLPSGKIPWTWGKSSDDYPVTCYILTRSYCFISWRESSLITAGLTKTTSLFERYSRNISL